MDDVKLIVEVVKYRELYDISIFERIVRITAISFNNTHQKSLF